MTKTTNQNPLTLEEYFNGRIELKNRDVGRPREETVKIQTFNAQLSLCDEYPLSLQEQILPIIDLMAIRFVMIFSRRCFSRFFSFLFLSNSHFKKLRDFVTLQLPNGFPVKIRKKIVRSRIFFPKKIFVRSIRNPVVSRFNGKSNIWKYSRNRSSRRRCFNN